MASSISARGDCESHDVKMTDKVAEQYGKWKMNDWKVRIFIKFPVSLSCLLRS